MRSIAIPALLILSASVILVLLFLPQTFSITVPTVSSSTPTTLTLPPNYPVGSVIMVGHWADTPMASTTELIAKYQPGGVIIMSAPENPVEIKTWVTTWQASSSQPLIIAIDQEGGEVSRLRGEGFTQTTQRSLETETEAYELGKKRGAELAALGITMNFAPVLDIATSTNSFMYRRAFAKPEQAARFAAAMTAGMADSSIIAAAKHFPGHPNTADDSHTTLPTVTITKSELDNFTKQFRDFIASANPAALMTAHVEFPNIDQLPATLSPFFLPTYLRDDLHFTGTIITDDLSMDAIDTRYPVEAAAVMSLSAGADMILLAAEPTSISTVLPAIIAEQQASTTFSTRLHDAQMHVYTLQQKSR